MWYNVICERVNFLTKQDQKFALHIKGGNLMKKIGVLGTGTMGAGIIQVLAQNGYEVVMRARRETSIEKGLATVKKNLDKMVAKERSSRPMWGASTSSRMSRTVA